MEDANCQAGGQAGQMQEATATTGTPSAEQIVAPEAMTTAEGEDGQSDADSQAMATEGNEDYHVAETHVEAAESSEVPKNDVEALPPSQPDGGHSVAESLVGWGEAEQAGVKPSTGPSDCEAEQAVESYIANKPDDVQAASKAQMSASKAVRRRAAQKARKRRGKRCINVHWVRIGTIQGELAWSTASPDCKT